MSKSIENQMENATANTTNNAMKTIKTHEIANGLRRKRRSALTNINNNTQTISTKAPSANANSSIQIPKETRQTRHLIQPKKERHLQIRKDSNPIKQNSDEIISNTIQIDEKKLDLSTETENSSTSNKRHGDTLVDPVDKRMKVDNETSSMIKLDDDWDDLDEEDGDDPLMVSEYVVEIFEYLHELEQKTLPDPLYFESQTKIQPKMRSILVDWIVETHLRFKLLPETLFLAINLMDRFLSAELVEVEKFQLLAVSCLFIAAKYEEVYSPSVKNYAVVTDGGYTEEEILDAEKAVVEILEFDLSYPNPMNFLRRISKADDYEVRTRTLGKYLLEVFTVDNRFIGVPPSLAAAAAMFVARKILNRGPWNNNLIHYSGGYTEEALADVCESLVRYLVAPIVHEQFFKKYASRKFMRASIISRQWAKQLVASDDN